MAVDARNNLLKKLKPKIENDSLIYVTPLPNSGMLYSAEIKEDTTHFSNKEMRLAFDLKFHIAIENKLNK